MNSYLNYKTRRRGAQVVSLVNTSPPEGLSRKSLTYNSKAAPLPSPAQKRKGREQKIQKVIGNLKQRRKAKMGNSSALVFISAIMALHFVLASSAVDFSSGGHHEFQLGWIPGRSACQGSIAECLAGDEFEMDSEINRRILSTKKYISYGALNRNSVPCSRRGASYYNCRHGAQANPYNRGCSSITRCRR